MGSVSLKIGDGTARFRRSTIFSSSLNLLMLSSVLATNLFALYAFTYHPHPHPDPPSNLTLISSHLASILREIDLSSRRLHQLHFNLSSPQNPNPLPPELDLFLSPHPLPLGPDSRSKLSHMSSSVAHPCLLRSPDADLLSQFMSYKPHSPCPSADSHLPHKLLSRGCHPLPRRRCLSQFKPRKLLPLPASLWHGIADAKSWVKPGRKNDFLIDEVLALGGGKIRVGFDVGGAADFAARMWERNVTVVTSGLDEGEAASARGVFQLQMPVANRFPFYDSVFDIVHTVNGFDEGGGKVEGVEFLMFDIDRVLRVGGLFWLDNYVCVGDERKRMVTRVIERFGYEKLRWVVGEKADGKKGTTNQVYLSAVLRKPARG